MRKKSCFRRSMNRREGDIASALFFFHQTCVNSHGKMICLETQHFNINRMLLLIVGLWPYQRSFLIELQLILFFGILITFIVFQVYQRIYCILYISKSYYSKRELMYYFNLISLYSIIIIYCYNFYVLII